jgi:hypothetical protein
MDKTQDCTFHHRSDIQNVDMEKPKYERTKTAAQFLAGETIEHHSKKPERKACWSRAIGERDRRAWQKIETECVCGLNTRWRSLKLYRTGKIPRSKYAKNGTAEGQEQNQCQSDLGKTMHLSSNGQNGMLH